ncbi:coiled-coil domain-containing protein 83-like [Gigantopelta aegis]|uniref:coiled-coil domain-containing protein 83-like n=1 Tax=Gigantopelta aegis TaxID=1735272 RepID=UPI001B88BD3E|nr:coiled-coil domain-containing protein 83-like [Gigantopelta aegis]
MAGKKKKGKSGKKGKKGGKKSKEPQMTAREAILAYRITITERKLEDVHYEIRGWEEKNKRHLERNDKLKTEQKLLIQHLLKQAKNVEKVFEGEEVKDRDDVIVAMKDKWQRQREREKELEVLKSEIAKKEVETEKKQREVHYWVNYKDKDHLNYETQIKVLEQELMDMQNTFDVMAAHLKMSLEESHTVVEKYTEETLAKQKDLATEKAIGKLDKYSRQEVLDNNWLKREVLIHKHEVEELTEHVMNLEKSNLDIMSQLFECTIDDLKISRQFFLTQFEDNENLEETGILELDLAQLSFPEECAGDFVNELAAEVKVRPKSAIQKAIENKVFSLVTPRPPADSDSEGEEEEEEEDGGMLCFLSSCWFHQFQPITCGGK